MRNDLLLLSNSVLHGLGYLEHARDAVAEFLGGRRVVYFAPYALADWDAYTARVARALAPLGAAVRGLHAERDPASALAGAEVLFVGGGNTFRLLRGLESAGVLQTVRQRVAAGELGYLGSSAGSNVACPTIRTTNDMPIVEPQSLAAFGLVPFQINPHYLDPDPTSTHMGETRAERITQFLEENDVAVLGMREGGWLRRTADTLQLQGETGAVLFRRGQAAERVSAGADLSFLLAGSARFDQPR